MITLSRFFKAVLIIVSMYMLEYLDIVLPSGNTDMFRVIIGGIAVTLALMTLVIPKKSPDFKKRSDSQTVFSLSTYRSYC